MLRLVAIVILILAASLAAWWFWHAESPATKPSQLLPMVELPPAGTPALPDGIAGTGVLVVWAAHTGARLEPCGCVAGMHGGLVRRASLIARLPEAQRLVLECGGWSGGSADYQRLRTAAYLQALQRATAAIVGLGAPEVRLGATHLRTLISGDGMPALVCANISYADGSAVVPAFVRRTIAGRDVVVTSVVPNDALGEGLRVSDPAPALMALTRTLAGASLVVLADLAEADLADLARSIPGIALVVGGAVQQPSRSPLAVGPTRVVHAANEGKTLGLWRWGAAVCAFELVNEAVPDHPQVRAAIRAYQEKLAGMDLAPDERLAGMTTLSVKRIPGAKFVGATVCTSCHAQAAVTHGASGHARALAALITKGYRHDPDCLRCHVTGLDLPDGFQRRSADAPQMHLGQVGCESCHGRGSVHVAERLAGRPASGSLQPVTPATCQRCHDSENSPQFEYATYWERIRHGHP